MPDLLEQLQLSNLQRAADALWQRHGAQLSDFGLRLAMALLILLLGFWLARRVGQWIKRAAERGRHIDATFAGVIASSASHVVLFLAAILVLQQFGVQTASVVAVLGAATLAIGLALQGTLANVAAGVLILVLRPYKLGDTVELGERTGTVREISLFTTELATFDNIRVVLPNGKIIGERITNISHHPTRRVDLEFRIAYEDDLEAAINLLRDRLLANPLALSEPAPLVEATELGEHAIIVSVLVWCKTSDWLPLRLQLIRDGLHALRTAGFQHPYPGQREAPLDRNRART